jgi:hypothetical protein
MNDNSQMDNKHDELEALKEPMRLLLEELMQLHDIIYVSVGALSVTQALPNAVEVLSQTERDETKKSEYEKSLVETKRVADVAKKEIEKGFPFLFSQAALMLYAHLEGSIKRFIIEYFRQSKSILNIKEVANLKITFAEYSSLDETERYDYLFSLYEKNIAMGMQYGVTRFEALLGPIGFSGEVKSSIKQCIFELSQIRNNLLHRGGIADKHLIKSCPSLNLVLGDKVIVSREHYEKYHQAISEYVLVIAIRLGEKQGRNMDEFKVEFSQTIVPGKS